MASGSTQWQRNQTQLEKVAEDPTYVPWDSSETAGALQEQEVPNVHALDLLDSGVQGGFRRRRRWTSYPKDGGALPLPGVHVGARPLGGLALLHAREQGHGDMPPDGGAGSGGGHDVGGARSVVGALAGHRDGDPGEPHEGDHHEPRRPGKEWCRVASGE